jgi:hypothetical protein
LAGSRGRTARVALGALAASVAIAGLAQAARVNLLDREYVIVSGGPTAWDARVIPGVSINCYFQGDVYTPVSDGQTYRGGSNHTDGFDDGAVFSVGTVAYRPPGNKVTAKGNTIEAGPMNIQGLRVSRVDTGLASGPLRSLVKLSNTQNSKIGLNVTWSSNLGSDFGEDIQSTSTGDQQFTNADRWVVSSIPPPLAEYDDPALTHVLAGKGAKEKPATILNAPDGSGCMTVDYDISIPANAERYLLFFTEMNPSPGLARTRANAFNSGQPAKLLKGIPAAVLARVLNWKL